MIVRSSSSVVLFLCFMRLANLHRDYWLLPLLPIAEFDLPFWLTSYSSRVVFYFRNLVPRCLTAAYFGISVGSFTRGLLCIKPIGVAISAWCSECAFNAWWSDWFSVMVCWRCLSFYWMSVMLLEVCEMLTDWSVSGGFVLDVLSKRHSTLIFVEGKVLMMALRLRMLDLLDEDALWSVSSESMRLLI